MNLKRLNSVIWKSMEDKKDFLGALTLASKHDSLKAIGLALSFKMHHPTIPISVVCHEDLFSLLEPFFDLLIRKKTGIKGYEHKIYLDEYTPYSETIFLDADMLCFGDVTKVCQGWSSYPYAAVGSYSTEGVSDFGLDTERVLEITKKTQLADINGSGHAYFRWPECQQLFQTGREVAANYNIYGANLRFADEDIMNIVMTMYDIPPQKEKGYQFFGMPCHAVDNSLEIDVTAGVCSYRDAVKGWWEPSVMHFARRQFPILYARQLTQLFRYHRVKIPACALWVDAMKNKMITGMIWPLKTKVKKIMVFFGLNP